MPFRSRRDVPTPFSSRHSARGNNMTVRRHAIWAVGLLLLVVLVVSPAAAANRTRASIWIDNSSRAAATTSLHFGDQVTFGFTTPYWDTTRGTGPWLELECSVNGTTVYVDRHAGFDGAVGYGAPFTLRGSVGWQSGPADCAASVGHFTKRGQYVADASLTINVAA